MRLTRRALLSNGAALGLWAWRGGAAAQSPDLAAGADGFRVIEATSAPLNLGAGAPSPLIGYGGLVPGPLLRAKAGEVLKLRFANKLTEPTTLSFPGLRLANAQLGIGGLTQPPVAPGASLDMSLAPPDPGFNLYLPHAGVAASRQISRGLFGPIVVEEAAPPAVDLEAIVVLADWRLDASGALADLGDERLARGAERLGALVTANGAPAPLALNAAPGARVRLRLGNAATARLMTLAIEGAPAKIVAVDGQPSELFAPLRDLVPVSPGARFELMFDLPREAAGAVRFVLRGREASDAGPAEPDRPVVIFTTSGDPVAARAPIAALPANPRLPQEIALENAKRFDLTISGGGDAPFAVDAVSFKGWDAKPSFAIPRGTPVTLGLVNKTAFTQTVRLNGHVARLLHALDDGWEPYWRDILTVQPGKAIHAAFVADNPGKWPIESASPERRASGLATWFQVT